LSFKPNQFFNELERTSGYSQSTLKHAYWRGRQKGFIDDSGRIPNLTASGEGEIRPFVAKHLGNKARLMVIFDVPEEKAATRQQFRVLLKAWGFEQIQKSVWASDLDYRELLAEAISELRIARYVEVYECMRLIPTEH
ncbi:MAG: CRISPR-associated endonuclease Cas2, partial [Candidatus Saccharimonadales bacterium]